MAALFLSEAAHDLRCRLSADAAIDDTTGVIRSCIVAKAGVQAQGKFVFIDAQGNVTRDEKLAKKRLSVFTDQKTLETLMTAAAAAGGRVKTREDHNDSVGARAGFTDAFKLSPNGSVVADVHLFDSYRNRATVLETAKKTPEEIGLSIDMVPEFEVLEDRALMRIKSLEAVDIVDAGAITPDGLLLSASKNAVPVNTPCNDKEPTQSPDTTMAADTSPSLSDVMNALSKLTAGYEALTKTMGEHAALLAKAAPAKVPDTDNDGMSAAKLAATLKPLQDQMAATTAGLAQLKKERALLGFRGTSEERVKLASASAEDIEALSATKKSYLQLVTECVEKEKCSKVEAHSRVQGRDEGRAAYAVHLSAKGVVNANNRMVAA